MEGRRKLKEVSALPASFLHNLIPNHESGAVQEIDPKFTVETTRSGIQMNDRGLAFEITLQFDDFGQLTDILSEELLLDKLGVLSAFLPNDVFVVVFQSVVRSVERIPILTDLRH